MKYFFLMLLCMLIIQTGCASKSSFLLTFDDFVIDIYDNNKPYSKETIITSTPDMQILTQMKETSLSTTTWFINSLLIVKTTVQSGINIQEFIQSNTKYLQLKVFKYTSLSSATKKLLCDEQQYSWYMITFSYQLDKEIIYGWQYFFIDKTTLYTVSLSSDDEWDIKSFVKSIKTITCTH